MVGQLHNEIDLLEVHLKKISVTAVFLSSLIALLAGGRMAQADSVIAPFVDSQTNAVIHVDLSTLDMDQVDAWQQKALTGIADPDQRAKQQQLAQKEIASAKDWIAKFKTAGGKDIYIVISLAGLIQGAPGGMIIPLNGADPAGIAKVINPRGNPPPADPNDPNAAQQARMSPQTAVVGDNIVFSTGSGLEKMKTPSTEARQDLADGLSSGGDSTVRLVLTPATLKNNPLFAAIVSSRMGAGPNGGAAQQPPFSEPQWDAVTWMSISVTAPPKSAGNCTIQCKDSDSASALSDMISKKIDDAKNDPNHNRGSFSADDFSKLMTAVKPAVSGTQVVISLDQDTIDNVVGPILAKSMQPAARPAAAPAAAPADNGGGM
jgi:hypothetical protein